jgi:hypothetical protein
MKTWRASKSGSVNYKFEAYIQSGTFYFAWRILKNGSSVVVGNYGNNLDSGQVSSVHEYRRFAGTLTNIEPGDLFTLQMVSSDGSGNPTAGNGQVLFAKEFRIFSGQPIIELEKDTTITGELAVQNSVRTWHLGQALRPIVQAGANVYRIYWRQDSNYYHVAFWDVYMTGGRDWGGYGSTGYFGKMCTTFSSVNASRTHLVQEFSRSYLRNNGDEIRFQGVSTSNATVNGVTYHIVDYAYYGFTTDGYQPNVMIMSFDPRFYPPTSGMVGYITLI